MPASLQGGLRAGGAGEAAAIQGLQDPELSCKKIAPLLQQDFPVDVQPVPLL